MIWNLGWDLGTTREAVLGNQRNLSHVFGMSATTKMSNFLRLLALLQEYLIALFSFLKHYILPWSSVLDRGGMFHLCGYLKLSRLRSSSEEENK